MERVRERLKIARKALRTLRELTDKPKLSIVERDAAIQRFEYTFEAVWKAAQNFLSENESIARSIFRQIDGYADVFQVWLDGMEKKLDEQG